MIGFNNDSVILIQANTLPKLCRSYTDYELVKLCVSLDRTDLNIYNEEGNCTCKVIRDLPEIMIDGNGIVFHLVKEGSIRTYLHRNENKLVCGYRGNKGEGYMLIIPSWEQVKYTKLGYYVQKFKKGDRKND